MKDLNYGFMQASDQLREVFGDFEYHSFDDALDYAQSYGVFGRDCSQIVLWNRDDTLGRVVRFDFPLDLAEFIREREVDEGVVIDDRLYFFVGCGVDWDEHDRARLLVHLVKC